MDQLVFRFMGEDFRIVFDRYQNGQLAVRMYTDDGPYCTVSVALEDVELAENEFVVSHNTPQFIVDMLLQSVHFVDTGSVVDYGYVKGAKVLRYEPWEYHEAA